MTILAAIVPHQDLGFLAADTLCFSANAAAAGHVSKLVLNPLACLALATCGSAELAHVAAAAATEARTLDGLAKLLPRRLRHAAGVHAERWQRAAPGLALDTTVAAVGWSHALRRIVAIRFSGAEFFPPYLTTRWGSPHVPALDALDPMHARDLVPACTMQMAELRAAYPDACDGALTVATITPGGVAAAVLLDFATGLPPTGPMRLHGRAKERAP